MCIFVYSYIMTEEQRQNYEKDYLSHHPKEAEEHELLEELKHEIEELKHEAGHEHANNIDVQEKKKP